MENPVLEDELNQKHNCGDACQHEHDDPEIVVDTISQSDEIDTYLDLVEFTLCNYGYTYRDDISRELEHYVVLAMMHNNVDFVHALMAVYEIETSLAIQDILEQNPELELARDQDKLMKMASDFLENNPSYKKDNCKAVTVALYQTHSMNLHSMNYQKIAKEIKNLFGVKVDKLRVKRVCDLCEKWGWLSRTGNTTYSVNSFIINYSAQHRTLVFDAELYEAKYQDELEN